MIPDFLDSLIRPAAYRRFVGEKNARTASYVAFLSLIFVAAIGVSVKLRLAPLFTETFSWLETSMPAINFAGGVVAADPPGPTRLEHPRAKDIAIMIDTNRKDPVTAAQMAEAKVLAYLTSGTLYLDRGEGKLESLDLSKSAAERPVKVDSNTYKDMERAFNWVFYPSILLFFFLAFALSLATAGLAYALVGMVMASVAHGSLTFPQLFRAAVHAQTVGTVLYAVDALSPVAIPFLPFVSMAATLTVLYLGVRAAVAPAETPVA